MDCRPSDGMILATLMDIPIFMSPEVMEEAGRELSGMLNMADLGQEIAAETEAGDAALPDAALIEVEVKEEDPEAAAVEASAAWLAGEPPRGRPCEGGADTSKTAMGGVMGQCSVDNGKLAVLMYWNALLSPAEGDWGPFEEELWGALQLRREEVKNFLHLRPTDA